MSSFLFSISQNRSMALPRVASFSDESAFLAAAGAASDNWLPCERMGVMAAFPSFEHFTKLVLTLFVC
jgi:hypothetical protein